MSKGKNKSKTAAVKRMMKDVKDSKPIGFQKRKSYNEH